MSGWEESMAPRKNTKSPTPSASSKEKGNVVEKIVAMMHEAPGVEVRRDVRLPARGCYGLNPSTAIARWRKRHAKATKCSPATISGSRS